MIDSDTYIDSWLPCSLVIEDCYIPTTAVPLLAGLRGLDDESCAVTIKLWAMDAEISLRECEN